MTKKSKVVTKYYKEADLDNIVKGFIRMENTKELAEKYIALMEA